MQANNDTFIHIGYDLHSFLPGNNLTGCPTPVQTTFESLMNSNWTEIRKTMPTRNQLSFRVRKAKLLNSAHFIRTLGREGAAVVDFVLPAHRLHYYCSSWQRSGVSSVLQKPKDCKTVAGVLHV